MLRRLAAGADVGKRRDSRKNHRLRWPGEGLVVWKGGNEWPGQRTSSARNTLPTTVK